MKRVLITGGSGYVGRHLIRTLLSRYPDIEITSLSRSEGIISQLLVECHDDRLKIVMVDVRDRHAVGAALRGFDTVAHLAAMKHVDLCEIECREAVSINIIGTMNVLSAFEGETFILMSTDKAVEPVGCYGASKLAAEKLVLEQAQKRGGAGSRFMILRSGNIIGSTGSVIDIWKWQIEKRNEITVTDPAMLRFYTSVEGVVRLYLAVLEHGENGKVYFTPSGEGMPLKDMLAKVLKQYGNPRTRIKFIGLRPGEKMSEKMCAPYEKDAVAGFEETIEITA